LTKFNNRALGYSAANITLSATPDGKLNLTLEVKKDADDRYYLSERKYMLQLIIKDVRDKIYLDKIY